MKKKLKKQIKKGEKRNQKNVKSVSLQALQLVLIGTLLVGVGCAVYPTASNHSDAQEEVSFKEVNTETMSLTYTTHAQDFPVSSQIIHRNGFTIAYDARSRVPLWVFEHVTPQRQTKAAKKKVKLNFQEDLAIAEHHRASNFDYLKSGFVQGILSSSSHYQGQPDQVKDAFLLSNITPQSPHFSKVLWNSLERSIQETSLNSKDVYVVTGVLFMPSEYEDGNRYVQYRVIGDHDVAVPTHFYKVILAESYSGDYEMSAYIIPNDAIPSGLELAQFKTTVEEVEKHSGLIFFDQLDQDVAILLKTSK